MADVRTLIGLAERLSPPAPTTPQLPDEPDYIDDERPEVTSGSKTRAAWRIPDESAAQWAIRKAWDAERKIAFATKEQRARLAELEAEKALILADVAQITRKEQRRRAFMEAVLLEWACRARDLIVEGRRKSRQFLYAVVGFRASPRKLVYDDEAAALDWCRAQGAERGLFRVAFEIEKDAVKTYCETHDVVPPGARWEGGVETAYLKLEEPKPLQLVKETP